MARCRDLRDSERGFTVGTQISGASDRKAELASVSMKIATKVTSSFRSTGKRVGMSMTVKLSVIC